MLKNKEKIENVEQNDKEEKIKKTKKKRHIDPTRVVATVIVSILVAAMLLGACGTLIFYLVY